MRRLVYLMYILCLLACAVLIAYQLWWDDASKPEISAAAISKPKPPSEPIKLKMQYVPLKAGVNSHTRLVRA
jgi:hypothetical protein